MNANVKELFGNQEFVEKFNALEGIESAKALFAEYGVEISNEELAELVNGAIENVNAEFSAEDLDDVNGGIFATLGAILAGSWALAVKTYGSPENAVREIGLFWARKLGYKG